MTSLQVSLRVTLAVALCACEPLPYETSDADVLAEGAVPDVDTGGTEVDADVSDSGSSDLDASAGPSDDASPASDADVLDASLPVLDASDLDASDLDASAADSETDTGDVQLPPGELDAAPDVDGASPMDAATEDSAVSSNDAAAANTEGGSANADAGSPSVDAGRAHLARLVGGGGQSARAGEALAAPIEIEVTDSNGEPLPDAEVVFSVSHGGSATPTRVTTDARGRAQTVWKLGPVWKFQTLSASVEQLADVVVQAGIDYQLVKMISVSGNDQTGAANQPLPQPVVVRVLDQADHPVAGFPVVFQTGYTESDFRVSTLSDADGYASAVWQVGPSGPAELYANTTTDDGQVFGLIIFKANVSTTEPGTDPEPLPTTSGGDQQGPAGSALPEPLVIYVRDAAGVPIVGRRVDFRIYRGRGTLSSTSVRTDALGRAMSTWTLGPVTGWQQVDADVFNDAGAPNNGFSFRARANPAVPFAKLVIISGNHSNVVAGSTYSLPVVLEAQTPAGDPFVGAFVGSQFSDDDGRLTLNWTIGTTAGLWTSHLTDRDNGPAAVDLDATVVPAAARRIHLLWGRNQTGWAGEALAEPFVFVVSDDYGNAVAGANVTLTPGAGGTVVPTSAISDTMGSLNAAWTLAPAAGVQTLSAALAGLPAQSFAATAVAPSASAVQLSALSGNSQTLATHARLNAPLRVQVSNALGAPVPGVGVSFTASDGSYLSSALVASDASGVAQWQNYLHAEGTLQIVAATPGSQSVTFTVNLSTSAHRYDGHYYCNYGDDSVDSFLIQSGALARPYAEAPPFYSSSFSEADGTLDYVARRSLDYRNGFHGQMVLNAEKRALGDGVVHIFDESLGMIGPGLPARCVRD